MSAYRLAPPDIAAIEAALAKPGSICWRLAHALREAGVMVPSKAARNRRIAEAVKSDDRTYAEIGRDFGVSKSVVMKAAHDAGLRRAPAREARQ